MQLSIRWEGSVPLCAGLNGNYSFNAEQLLRLLDSLTMNLQRYVADFPSASGHTELTVSIRAPALEPDA